MAQPLTRVLSDSINIEPCQPLDATITPPGSKSITNRALVCAALASGKSTLTGALESDDTLVMIDSLKRLGIDVHCNWESSTLTVDGCSGKIPHPTAELFVGNSGTTIRFLTALCTLGEGNYRLSGVPRMHERPIQPLANALNQLGCDVTTENEGCPPVNIVANGLRGRHAKVESSVSSQFASALIMIIPFANEFTVLQLCKPVVSKPYIDMTCRVMAEFGVDIIRLDDFNEFSTDPNQTYDPCDFYVEPDASAASYFWAAAAIAGGSVTVNGLTEESIQGDVQFVEVLAEMGCEVDYLVNGIRVTGPATSGVDIDMGSISDTAQTLAAVALFVEGPTRIRGVSHNRVKETDRIGNLATELRKLGADVREHDDGLEITPGLLQPATISTYDDHRMAMSLSLAGLRQPGVEILDPECVAKTYPRFFEDLKAISKTN